MASERRPEVAALADHHDRSSFSCGDPALDRYLKTQAGQDFRKRVAAPFVLTLPPAAQVIGYYTLSAAAIPIGDLPVSVSKKLPRYPSVPATLLGRLAVDVNHRAEGFGLFLLLDAVSRTLRNEIASMAIMVDAKDDTARRFYVRHEFIEFPDRPQRLFLPLITAGKLLSS